MAVGANAIMTLEEYLDYAGITDDELLIDGIEVYCSAGDATSATVSKSGSTLSLVITGGASAGTTNIDLTLAANDTLAELAAVIAGTSGWEGRLINTASGGIDSANLRDLTATNCLGTGEAKNLLAYNYRKYERLIDSATAMIETFLKRKIKSRTLTHERYTGRGLDSLFLTTYPVTALERVSAGEIDAINIKNTAGEFNAYAVVSETGVSLVVDGSAGGEVAFASYATMELLAAELNNAVGWEAEVTNSTYNDWPSDLLFPHPNYYALNTWGSIQCPNEPIEDFEID